MGSIKTTLYGVCSLVPLGRVEKDLGTPPRHNALKVPALASLVRILRLHVPCHQEQCSLWMSTTFEERLGLCRGSPLDQPLLPHRSTAILVRNSCKNYALVGDLVAASSWRTVQTPRTNTQPKGTEDCCVLQTERWDHTNTNKGKVCRLLSYTPHLSVCLCPP